MLSLLYQLLGRVADEGLDRLLTFNRRLVFLGYSHRRLTLNNNGLDLIDELCLWWHERRDISCLLRPLIHLS